MSSGKRHEKKRKHHSPSPLFKSQIAKRLEKLRGRHRDLWEDDDDDDDEPSQPKNQKIPRIVLPDSDAEKPPSSSDRRLHKSQKKKKTSQKHHESATCLICSILSQLSSHNCCSQHLSILKNHSHHRSRSIHSQHLPEQVMIIPMTDEVAQHYRDPQQTPPFNKRNSKRSVSTQQSPKLSTKSARVDIRPLASTIVVGTSRSKSATDVPITTVTPTCIPDHADNRTHIDEHHLQRSPIENTLVEPTTIPSDPWIPISDEIDAALELALGQMDSSSDKPLEYTPATARRTETEIMAARLPKIPLKEGRFRFGKPITNRSASNAANEYRPLAATAQCSTPPSISSATATNISPPPPPPPTATNIENITSGQTPKDNHNEIFTQDEPVQTDNLPTTSLTDENIFSVLSENFNGEIEVHRSNENHPVTLPTLNDKPTPSRLSYRLNPDGTRVSISRPPLPTNPRSPLSNFSYRTSPTDLTPNSKQV